MSDYLMIPVSIPWLVCGLCVAEIALAAAAVLAWRDYLWRGRFDGVWVNPDGWGIRSVIRDCTLREGDDV